MPAFPGILMMNFAGLIIIMIHHLIDRFIIYRTYWDEESLRFTVIDNGVEYDLYTDPFPIDSVSAEFQAAILF